MCFCLDRHCFPEQYDDVRKTMYTRRDTRLIFLFQFKIALIIHPDFESPFLVHISVRSG